MVKALRLLSALTFIVLPVSAHGQWEPAPNGDFIYHSSYSTTGSLGCGAFFDGSCEPTGTGIRITSGTAWLDLSFANVTHQPVAATVDAQPIVLGFLTTALGGTGPFAFPTPSRVGGPIFGLSLLFGDDNFGNGDTSVYLPFLFGRTSDTDVLGVVSNDLPHDITYRLGYPPNDPTSRELLYHVVDAPLSASTGTFVVPALVATIPEPTSLVLMATGLVVLVGIGRHRSRRATGGHV